MSDVTRQVSPGDLGSAASVAAALEAALEIRAPGVHASTPLVRQLAAQVGRELGLDTDALALLDVAVRVRDIGMIALPDGLVLATRPLSPADWKLVNRHPEIGERLLVDLSGVVPAAAIVRAHHERWDGDGYPDGRRGDEIPRLSRVIATCDAFVAVASDRPHRRGLGAQAALELVRQESGSQFDPDTTDALAAVLSGHAGTRPSPGVGRAGADPSAIGEARVGPHDLTNAISEFGVIPALAPAYERVLAATASAGTTLGELVEAVESDTGLTVAVLRRAQAVPRPRPRPRPIATVAEAVVTLGPAGVRDAVTPLPRAEFPWRTSQLEILMHRSLVHAQAVARAADRIAAEVKLTERDDVMVAALLHDVGKLVLGRAIRDYTGATDRTGTPEARLHQEQRDWGVDHASLGGLLVRRWGLPPQLARVVAAHHSAESQDDIATYVRLADMVAHHAQGDTVERGTLLDLAHLCGLSPRALREILFDLPHAAGSHRHRAEPSPFTNRETAVLSRLAEGKVYKVIATELGVSPSTVSSHLQNVYAKLGVDDRAQAVLRAAERGWI